MIPQRTSEVLQAHGLEAKVFEESPLALELEKMRITAGMYSDRDKIIIVPTGTDLSMILGGGVVLPTE